MRFCIAFLLVSLSLIVWSADPAPAPLPFLHPIFSDGCVFPRDMAAPVWGWATPGTSVEVAMNGKKARGVADGDGRWLAHLGPFPAGGPFTLTVSGPESVTVSDVLVGDVWLCSGQSNMDYGITVCTPAEELAKPGFADLSTVRLLTVPGLMSHTAISTCACSWRQCRAETLSKGGWGGFTAVGFFFGRELNRDLKIPIGLIHASWGGTPIEYWTSSQAQDSERRRYIEAWFATVDPGTAQGWFKPETDVSTWRLAKDMPKNWERAGLPDYDGIAWLQKTVDIPADWTGKDLLLDLGNLDDSDATWFNGIMVGTGRGCYEPRRYRVPARAVHPGRTNVISIRVLDNGGDGGLTGPRDHLGIYPIGDTASTISLAGTWRMRETTPLSKLGTPHPFITRGPGDEGNLYNGMISAIVPFGLKGVIWYQGEANAEHGWRYRTMLPMMIADWRARFEQDQLPFHVVSLANFKPMNKEPCDNDWAELREAQAITVHTTPHCGLAVAIDLGEAGNIHPHNKLAVGLRLARCAQALTYGEKNVEWSGPWYRSMKTDGASVVLSFDHLGGGLLTKDGEKLVGFAIAGADRHFVWGDAVIAGDTVVVTAAQVPNPVAVRYAWDANPACNLYNKAGLPAVPFRTDDFPEITRDKP